MDVRMFTVGQIAENLGQLYVWIIPQLVQANADQDVAKIQHVRSLVAPIAEAWHVAAAECTNAGRSVRVAG